MGARLNAVQPLLEALLAEPQPSLSIVGLDPVTRLVWIGVTNFICFVLPPSINNNPKYLILWLGDDSGSSGDYYPDSLGNGDLPMPVESQGCTNFSVSQGVAPGLYTISMQDPMGRPFAAISFNVDVATLTESAFSLYTQTTGAVTVSWSMPVSRASVTDAVWVLDSNGALAYRFYTSCGCQTTPGAVAVASGTYVLMVTRPAVAGGYTFELHPQNGAAVATTATNWIPWSQILW